MTWLKRIFLLIAILTILVAIYSARSMFIGGPQLANLDASSTVVVDYWTGGCDHSQHYMVTFRGELPENARIELIMDAGKSFGFEDKKTRVATVYQNELKSIDDYLQSRRKKWFDTGMSTESRVMSLSWFRGGQLWHQETFIDRMPNEHCDDRFPLILQDLVRTIYPSHVERFEIGNR